MKQGKRWAGLFVLLIGIALATWIGYNLLVEMQPEAKGRSPIGPSILAASCMYVGFNWLRGRKNTQE